MAPKKNHKQAQETMLEETVKDRVILSESIGEEEQDELENEEEH
jgi:DNA/RNA-binding domain of Phe-tRNA-synthetase-like protein